MVSIDIFYQGEGLGDVAHIEVSADSSIADVKALIAAKHGFELHRPSNEAKKGQDKKADNAGGGELGAFIEDSDEALDDTVTIGELSAQGGALKLHVHFCRQIEVTIRFAGASYNRKCPPSYTVAKTKNWAVHQVHMSPEDATEHVLQLAGTPERPAPGTHLGSLISGHECHLIFDLVADERVNGAAECEEGQP